ncbi:T9SS type A sorting domain-containing protein [Paucihalobacter sp.]|uniref:T9SS type A sorting domain-containing protein n=2 Tax=Paucihalobacter sp. TaxID=2850405 RepID=UPI003D1605D0
MKKITFIIFLFLCHLGISQNVVINGDFNDGLNSWSSFIADFAGVNASVSAANNEANITNITGAGGQVWHIQLNQILTAGQISSLQVGESYKISFSARSNTNNRQLRLYFGQDGGAFQSITIQDYQITTNMEAYEAVFTIGQTFGAMKLGFEMGLSNNPVFIDNVVLELNTVDPLTDANLSGLEVDNNAVPGFSPEIINYSIGVGIGSPVPQITAAPTSNPNANTVITQATAIPGNATVVVTAEDGVTTKTYTIAFEFEGPTTPAPTPPARPAENVLSIYSDAYTDIVIDDFDFGLCGNNPAVEEVSIAGNPTLRYLGPGCQGIDIQNNRIDASTFTNLHFDFYTDDAIVGAVFNIKLVDWAGNETEAGSTGLEVIFNGGTNPPLVANEWVSVDVNITALGGMILGNLTRSDVAQIHITSNLPNAWYDNFYLYKDPGTCDDGIQNQGETGVDCGGPCAPCTGPPSLAAPTPPARPVQDVISFYSDAYTDVTIDNFDFGLCNGGVPDLSVSEVLIDNNPTILYSGSGCQGIDFQNDRQDASEFTRFHVDVYTDDADMIGKVFNIKLVDWAGNPTDAGATGLEINFNGGTNPPLVANQWVSIDVDITALGGMVAGNLTRSDIAQIHITSNLNNAWYDNLYLHKNTTLSTDEFTSNDFKVYPNPSNFEWNVEANSTIKSVSLVNILGKQVLKLEPNSSSFAIDNTSLATGLYFATIATENGSSVVKLIKN